MTENNIIIRFATYDDVDKIMIAIKEHWNSNHILAHNKDFFLYCFGGNDIQINMAIGENHQTKEIAGFLGFTKYSIDAHCDMSPILWKVISPKDSYLGVELFFFLINQIKPEFFFGTGVNPNTALPIFRFLKYHTGKLEHYYRISEKSDYKIAKIENKDKLPIVDYGWSIQLISGFNDFKNKITDDMLSGIYPHKDVNYFFNRFFKHPIYKYLIYGAKEKNNGIIRAFIVCREVELLESKILRIVDYVGDEIYLSYLSLPLQELMVTNDYEYMDCYCSGIQEKTMNSAGFILRKENDRNIIPNYFDPFLCENADIYYYVGKNTEKFRLFRGDGDQDQPRTYRVIRK